tara:strand:+ start:283 stop:513 length:231 start_codon:yes stop_codon:yes gene_type:complete
MTIKETQTQKVTRYLFENGNTDNKTISNELNIISHNVRRITGQETLKENFVRVSKGVYNLSESKRKEYQELIKEVG